MTTYSSKFLTDVLAAVMKRPASAKNIAEAVGYNAPSSIRLALLELENEGKINSYTSQEYQDHQRKIYWRNHE